MILENLKSLFLDFLFPITCAGCGKGKIHCCESCFNSIPVLQEKFCAIEKDSALDGIFAAAHFQEKSVLAELIHRFKYDGAKEISKILVSLFGDFRPQNFPKYNCTTLVPVPLHKRRFNSRGFNQSEVLALELSKRWGLPIENILVRHRYTKPQVELNEAQRLENVRDAFSLKNSAAINKNAAYILMDDVMTTGATMNECAKVLKMHGARKILGLVIAKTC